MFSTRGRLGRSLGIATTDGSLCIASPARSLSLADRHHALLRAMNDAQFRAPAVADIDNAGILVTGLLRLFRAADLVDLGLGDDGGGRRISGLGRAVIATEIRTATVSKTLSAVFFRVSS